MSTFCVSCENECYHQFYKRIKLSKQKVFVQQKYKLPNPHNLQISAYDVLPTLPILVKLFSRKQILNSSKLAQITLFFPQIKFQYNVITGQNACICMSKQPENLASTSFLSDSSKFQIKVVTYYLTYTTIIIIIISCYIIIIIIISSSISSNYYYQYQLLKHNSIFQNNQIQFVCDCTPLSQLFEKGIVQIKTQDFQF
eukprot:TRINITY_DN4630_c0_g1_i1.p2 TRINITY_DN4630_c0_g1~~TRINITY_DN4630_c0_g1_i1.p2  ORF type:complete len:198 (-),score=-14.78 TRINITY_DN4630_c0_g1_i1:461-1054(-)